MTLQEGSRSVRMMGTKIDLSVTVCENPQLVLDTLVELLKKYEHRFSANDDASELMAINLSAGGDSVQVHPELFELIKIGKEHSMADDSLLNIAIGPLIQTWRIGFDDATVPTADDINEQLAITNPADIELDETTHSVRLVKPGMKIDLGALAKGYIADRMIDYLESIQAKSALINLGGNLVTYGPSLKRPDLLWRIGIQNPDKTRGESQIILKVPDKSVVTSGIYERQLTRNGETFHHIFNPKTGYPVETNLASLTIVSDLSVDGEIWTTRLFGHAPDEILKTLNTLPNIDGLIISQQGDIQYSDGLKKYLLN